MKVGGLTFKEDVDRVYALRRQLGDDIRIMVDANEAYDPMTAIQLLPAHRRRRRYMVRRAVLLTRRRRQPPRHQPFTRPDIRWRIGKHTT